MFSELEIDLGLQSKMILYAAIGGLLAMMGGFVYFASLDNPQLEQAQTVLDNVEVLEVNTVDNTAKLQVTFLVTNPSEKTFTVPAITYSLFANDSKIGDGKYSTEDIAMAGRAAFYPGSEIPLKSNFHLSKAAINPDIYDAIVEGNDVEFRAEGIITVESAWSIVETEF